MIKIFDLSARVSPFKTRINEATQRVVDSGWVVLGPENSKFEDEFSTYTGVRHVIGVANATDALLLSMRAMQQDKKQFKIASVGNASFYAATAARNAGAELVFMDVNPSTHLVRLHDVSQAIAEGADLIVATHLYGLAIPEIEEIANLCKLSGVSLLEDCSQAHGAMINGRRVGSFGDAACFSFYPTKNLGALGDGGAVATNSDQIAARVKQLRQYGWSSKYHVEYAGGMNSRLDEMQAAILLEFLPHLDEMNSRRRAIAAAYSAGISHPDITTPPVFGTESVAHLYVVRSSKRNALAAYLKANNIATDIHYPIPDHQQPIWRGQYSELQLVNTEQLAQEVLTLPCYPELPMEHVSKVIEVINSWKP